MHLICGQEAGDTLPAEIAPHGWCWHRPTKAQSAVVYWDPRTVRVTSKGAFKTSSEGDPLAPRYIVWVEIDGWLRVGSTHLPANKDKPANAREHTHQADRCAAWLDHPGRVLAGDLNANPGSDWMAPLRDVGARHHKPTEPGTGPHGQPIDHVWTSRDLPRPVTLGTMSGSSDHDALVVEVTLT